MKGVKEVKGKKGSAKEEPARGAIPRVMDPFCTIGSGGRVSEEDTKSAPNGLNDHERYLSLRFD